MIEEKIVCPSPWKILKMKKENEKWSWCLWSLIYSHRINFNNEKWKWNKMKLIISIEVIQFNSTWMLMISDLLQSCQLQIWLQICLMKIFRKYRTVNTVILPFNFTHQSEIGWLPKSIMNHSKAPWKITPFHRFLIRKT